MASVQPGALANMLTRGLRTPTQNKAMRGIFCGSHIQFGNNVSFSERKTRRSFKPNVQSKRLRSEILQETFRINVTAHALRCIKKAGGFDKFLLEKPKLLTDSITGQLIRERLLTHLALQDLEKSNESNDTPKTN